MLNVVQNKYYLKKKHYNRAVTPSSERIVTRQSQVIILAIMEIRVTSLSVHDSFGTKGWTLSVHDDFGTYEIDFGTCIFL